MNLNLRINDLLFLDIETVPQEEFWSEVPEITKNYLSRKQPTNAKKTFHQKPFMNARVFGQNLGK